MRQVLYLIQDSKKLYGRRDASIAIEQTTAVGRADYAQSILKIQQPVSIVIMGSTTPNRQQFDGAVLAGATRMQNGALGAQRESIS